VSERRYMCVYKRRRDWQQQQHYQTLCVREREGEWEREREEGTGGGWGERVCVGVRICAYVCGGVCGCVCGPNRNGHYQLLHTQQCV